MIYKAYKQFHLWDTLSPEDVVGLTGLSATSTVGTISPTAMSVGLTGQQATTSVGEILPADVIGLTGLSATSSVGSIVPAIGVPLTGLPSALTSSVGAISPTSMTVGLTGLSMTSTVGTGFVLTIL